MIDPDLECVYGEGDVLDRTERKPSAQVEGFLSAQRFGAEQSGGGIRDRDNQYVGSRYTQIDDLTPGIGTVNINPFGSKMGGPLTQPTFTFNPLLPAYNLVNLRLGLTRSTWEAALFVNNLTNEQAQLALDRERGLRARVGYLTNQPRTFGTTLRFNY